MIRGAIFDVDGTLLDSMTIWEEAGTRYLRRIHKEPEENLSKVLFPMSLEEGAAYMKRQYDLTYSEEEIICGVLDTVKEFYYKEALLKEGAKEFLEQFVQKGIPITVATTGEKEYVMAAFRRLHIASYVKRIFTCSEVGKGKSSPEIYHAAARYMGTVPEETWVFEDVLHAIRTARTAGYHVAAIYDQASEEDQEKIRDEAEVYLRTFWGTDTFWKRVREETEE